MTVVASLAADLLQQNLAVGMFARAEKEMVVLPRQGQAHLWTLLQALAPLHAAQNSSLEEVLTQARGLYQEMTCDRGDLLLNGRLDWRAAAHLAQPGQRRAGGGDSAGSSFLRGPTF